MFLPLLWKPLAEWPVLPWAKGEGRGEQLAQAGPPLPALKEFRAHLLEPWPCLSCPATQAETTALERKGMECPQAPSLRLAWMAVFQRSSGAVSLVGGLFLAAGHPPFSAASSGQAPSLPHSSPESFHKAGRESLRNSQDSVAGCAANQRPGAT